MQSRYFQEISTNLSFTNESSDTVPLQNIDMAPHYAIFWNGDKYLLFD